MQPLVLQEYLNNFEEWTAVNKMKICVSMKVSFLINNSWNKPQKLPLTISEKKKKKKKKKRKKKPLHEVQVSKIMGVEISDDLG